MNKTLVIVFVKNAEVGKVKTRLAKTIGHERALDVYNTLLKLTETVVEKLSNEVHIYFSNSIENTTWKSFYKTIQKGTDLGERMFNAFNDAFKNGYKKVVLIGSDLPDINPKLIEDAFEALNQTEVVFGPATDGGYYLVGLTNMHASIFKNKPWSESHLLKETLEQLDKNHIKFTTLETLNDIDTYEDLIASEFYKSNLKLQEKIKQLHD